MLEPGDEFPVKTSDSGTPQVGPRELLPDLDQRAPFRLTIAGTKLGFASATDNVGEGPVWVRGSRPSAAGPMRATQLVRMSDRSVRSYPDAGRLRYTPSSTHTHWHLLGFQRYELRTLDGDLVVRDRKSGFCLADHYGLAARRVTAFTGGSFYGNCAQSNPGALSVEQGTSIGFTDLYPAHFHGQNLELRGVPAGVYVLVHRANPDQRLEELDYTNNDASLRIRLTWSGGTPHVRDAAHLPGVGRLLATGARPSAAGSANRSGSRSGSSGPAAVAVEQERLHPERARALDVVLVGVADHRRLLRLDRRAAPARGGRSRGAASCGRTRASRSRSRRRARGGRRTRPGRGCRSRSGRS